MPTRLSASNCTRTGASATDCAHDSNALTSPVTVWLLLTSFLLQYAVPVAAPPTMQLPTKYGAYSENSVAGSAAFRAEANVGSSIDCSWSSGVSVSFQSFTTS